MNDTKRGVLAALAEGPATGPELAETMGITRTAVWKHVEGLREAGFDVESGPGGYALRDVPEFGGATVELGLDASFSIEYHDAIESTNDRGRELAVDGVRDVVVLADRQTGGRGRQERTWSSPSGGVWASLVLEPSVHTARLPLFTLAGAVATADAVREAGVDARIKWPNDVVVPADTDRGYEKLAGVLTEMEAEADRVHWLVVGIGVNVDVGSDELPDGATSVREHVGEVDRRAFTQRLLQRFDELRGDHDSILPAWRERSLTLGQRVRIETPDGPVVGDAVDVVDPGALVVDTGQERVSVHVGDCDHLRPTRDGAHA